MAYDEVFQSLMQQLEQMYQEELAIHQTPEKNDLFQETISELYELYEHGEFKEAKAVVKAQSKLFDEENYPAMNDKYRSLFDVLKKKHVTINNANISEMIKAKKQRATGINYPYVDLLNLEKIILYGWETKKSDKVIEKMIETIEKGQHLRPIYVYKMTKTQYQLAEVNSQGRTQEEWQDQTREEQLFSYDGGHTRAVSNFIIGRLQPVIVLGEKRKIEYVERPVSIRNIVLEDDDESDFPLWKLAMQDENYQ